MLAQIAIPNVADLPELSYTLDEIFVGAETTFADGYQITQRSSVSLIKLLSMTKYFFSSVETQNDVSFS